MHRLSGPEMIQDRRSIQMVEQILISYLGKTVKTKLMDGQAAAAVGGSILLNSITI